MYQVTAPHFCAGIEVKDEVIVLAAPILRWSLGKTLEWFQSYCKVKKWSITKC